MKWITILAAPLIGALIGYCTNYIAVKMLFRPLKPIQVGGVTLPFTPGIIPKRKPVLAHAIGQMVGKSLVGEKEIREILTSTPMKNAVVTSIAVAIQDGLQEKSIKEIATLAMDDTKYLEQKESVVNYLTDRVADGVKSIDIAGILVAEGTEAVKKMGGMIAMFVNENTIATFAEPIASKAEAYMEVEGKEFIFNKVNDEITTLEGKTIAELTNIESMDSIKEMIGQMYETMLEREIGTIVNAFDICSIVEQKIKDMDVLELEQLIMSVMKHELGVIVNLGALIGFVLGLINLLF